MFAFLHGSERTYLDYASATPCRAEVQRVMRDLHQVFGNPGAPHAEGRAAAARLAVAREDIARAVGCRAREIVFVSGATEGNNLAIGGVVRRLLAEGVAYAQIHAVTSTIEHPSVLECFAELERRGAAVSYVAPDAQGRIDATAVAQLLTPQTRLVSVGLANSEIGVVQPISAIADAVHDYSAAITVHTDIGQAPLYMHTQMHSLRVDLATFDSGKLYGPRGIGAVYVATDTTLRPIFYGGGQERGLRPGSEAVTLAAGFAEAFTCADRERAVETKRLTAMRTAFLELLADAPELAGVIVNGSEKHTLPHVVNISIPDVDTEYIMLALDQRGIAVSTKSSCREGEAYSHVVRALGDATAMSSDARARSTLRFSFGADTRVSDARRAARALAASVAAYRSFGGSAAAG